MAEKKLALFGSTGALGSVIRSDFVKQGWHVNCGTFDLVNPEDFIMPLDGDNLPANIATQSFDAVVFAQGANMNGTVLNTTKEQLLYLFEANVSFISDAVATMMKHDLIKTGAKIVIISSLWEQQTREDKFAYTVTKAAVGGLVRSLAVDLGIAKGILVNGVLPGVVDTTMARDTLGPEKIKSMEGQTPGNKLVTPQDVASSVYMLCSDLNTAISGQSIFVDFGFAIARKV
jgi:hypothetical protein